MSISTPGLNYKSPTFSTDLASLTRDKLIDVYFDNVGGSMLDTVLGHMAMHGRVALCGAISSYNATSNPGVLFTHYAQMITMRLALKGFVVHDVAGDEAWRERFTEKILGSELLGGVEDTVVEGGVEDIPRVWLGLFEGSNKGKLITKLVK